MAITETVKGRFHILVSTLTLGPAMIEICDFLDKSHVNPDKVEHWDALNGIVIFTTPKAY